MDNLFQFTDIPRPAVAQQYFFCRLVKIRNLLSQLSGGLDTEKISQREYVFVFL